MAPIRRLFYFLIPYFTFLISYFNFMPPTPSNDPLHGITLQTILEYLVQKLGWTEMAANIRIKCFTDNPSVSSSLKFLRKTPWARKKVEDLYVWMLDHSATN